MKLTLQGHEDLYAVEQLQLALFPDDAEGTAVSVLHRGKTWLTATAKITYQDRTATASRRIKAAEETVRLCRELAVIYGLPAGADMAVTFDWGNGVLFDEEKVWADYLAMADRGLIAPEVALGWRFGMAAQTEAERAKIRRKYMPAE